jgi:hypothetical protein
MKLPLVPLASIVLILSLVAGLILLGFWWQGRRVKAEIKNLKAQVQLEKEIEVAALRVENRLLQRELARVMVASEDRRSSNLPLIMAGLLGGLITGAVLVIPFALYVAESRRMRHFELELLNRMAGGHPLR